MDAQPFWARPVEAVLAELESAPTGLSADEARARLKRYGPNEPAPPRRFEPLREIASYLVNPLVLILLCASAVSAIFGQVVSSLVVAVPAWRQESSFPSRRWRRGSASPLCPRSSLPSSS